jgi:hypothetical protein
LSNYFFQISEQGHLGHGIFLVIGRLINFTHVSSTVVRHINDDDDDGNDPSSNTSVTEAENMWYRWKKDITLPEEKCLCGKRAQCCILVCASFGMPEFYVCH